LYHNDYKPRHFFVDNNQIKLIDWSGTRPKKKQKKITNDMNHIIENLD